MKTFNEELRENLQELYDRQLVFIGVNESDSYDNCILGVHYDTANPKVVYSANKIIKTIMQLDKVDFEQAYEYFNYNIESDSRCQDHLIMVDSQMIGGFTYGN